MARVVRPHVQVMASMRPLGIGLLVGLAVSATATAGYVYARRVGLEVAAPADALVLPAGGPASSKAANGSVTTIVEVTPAPWPAEARAIQRLTSLGIPVRVVVRRADGPVRFVVRKAGGGQLAAVFRNRADAERLSLVSPP